ncbi:MAG: glycosyltransferase, partial [Planctomycetota bacterium]
MPHSRRSASDVNGVGSREFPLAGKSMALYERGFFRPRRKKPVHGVELFRIMLLGDLARLGMRITVLCEKSWDWRVLEFAGELSDGPGGIEFVTMPYLRRARPTGWCAARKLIKSGQRFDILMGGDPDVRTAGGLKMLMKAGLASRTLIMADGRGRDVMLKRYRRDGFRFDVHTISMDVAEDFAGKFDGRLTSKHGIANAADFLAVTPAYEREPNEKVKLGLFARLPSSSKGEEATRAAWAMLPAEVRAKAELHLAGYLDPPQEDAGSGIVNYNWVPYSEAPSWMASMDIMVVHSTRESFCQSMVQGMLVGLPILSSTLPVLTEKLDTGGGIACEGVPELAAGMGLR